MLIRLDSNNQFARDALGRLFKQFYILPDPISGKTPEIILTRNREKIAEVYKLRLKGKAGLNGEMIIKVIIDNEGQLIDVIMEKDNVGDPVLEICAIWNIRRSKFPKGFGATYQFELILNPGT
jgi:hypothetical protein